MKTPSIPFYKAWHHISRRRTNSVVLIHLGNINNCEREYKGREKKCVGNIRKGDRTQRLLTLGNELGVVEGEKGRGWRGMGDGH